MEVHAHTHTARKKWTHYFWEFLMLFLAVFCGFLAENQREHMVEHQREKKFIRSLSSDLEADISRLKEIIQQRNERDLRLDSFLTLLNGKDALQSGSDLYYYNSIATRGVAFRFTPVDGTMLQLKNAGNLRLIQKAFISDSIISYDVAIRAYVYGNTDEEEIMDTYRDIAEGVFDGKILNDMRDKDNNLSRLTYSPPLRLTGDAVFRLSYRIHMLIAYNRTMRREASKMLNKATNLLDLLKKEYHLK
jgi:hypothetical protein